jgi:hypothetical protein
MLSFAQGNLESVYGYFYDFSSGKYNQKEEQSSKNKIKIQSINLTCRVSQALPITTETLSSWPASMDGDRYGAKTQSVVHRRPFILLVRLCWECSRVANSSRKFSFKSEMVSWSNNFLARGFAYGKK